MHSTMRSVVFARRLIYGKLEYARPCLRAVFDEGDTGRREELYGQGCEGIRTGIANPLEWAVGDLQLFIYFQF